MVSVLWLKGFRVWKSFSGSAKHVTWAVKALHTIIIIIIIIILIFWEFFTTELADDFSLEFEWQQVSSSLQDSSQYSGLS